MGRRQASGVRVGEREEMRGLCEREPPSSRPVGVERREGAGLGRSTGMAWGLRESGGGDTGDLGKGGKHSRREDAGTNTAQHRGCKGEWGGRAESTESASKSTNGGVMGRERGHRKPQLQAIPKVQILPIRQIHQALIHLALHHLPILANKLDPSPPFLLDLRGRTVRL